MDTGVTNALGLTLQVAIVATVAVMIPGTLLAFLLARKRFFGSSLVSALVSLPLVMPPTAVGYLLLRALSRDGLLGSRVLGFDPNILLTWKAATLAAAVMALPLVVRTARVTFESLDPRLEDVARTLGKGRWRVFFTVTLPLAARGLTAAAILGFTRAVGEFGATVTVAGNIPGRTQTLAGAIFSAQQVGDRPRATLLLIVAIVVGLAAVLASEALVRRGSARSRG